MFAKLFICAIAFQVVLSRPQDSEDEGRIVGGSRVTIEKYPYQVGVQFPDDSNPGYIHKCGGCIILENLVLTAAHCTEFSPQERAGGKVHVGSADFWFDGEFINILQIVDHPQYVGKPENWNYDISVLRLAHAVTFSSAVQTISIASYARKNGDIVTVAGWGRTVAANAASGSQILLGVDLKFIETNTCRAKSTYGNAITDNMVCAGEIDSHLYSPNACKGDSGGPLVHEGEVVGIVSWSTVDCGAPGSPGVFTNVYELRHWVNDQMDLLSSPVWN